MNDCPANLLQFVANGDQSIGTRTQLSHESRGPAETGASHDGRDYGRDDATTLRHARHPCIMQSDKVRNYSGARRHERRATRCLLFRWLNYRRNFARGDNARYERDTVWRRITDEIIVIYRGDDATARPPGKRDGACRPILREKSFPTDRRSEIAACLYIVASRETRRLDDAKWRVSSGGNIARFIAPRAPIPTQAPCVPWPRPEI